MGCEFNEESIEKVSRCMKALAHPLRIKVIVALKDKELSVQELVEAVGTTQSNVSQHLTIMRDKEILASRRVANQVFYRVGDCKVLDLVALTKKIFCTQTQEAGQTDSGLVKDPLTLPPLTDLLQSFQEDSAPHG
ncbi:MAG: metalloregulator ArsR/SmtB family transcription factor [Magnetococcus sp. DMHC-1]